MPDRNMPDTFCSREEDIITAMHEGRSLDTCPAELRDHVAMCEPCRQLVELASALLIERTEAMREAPLPGSGLVWWRMQARMRRDTQRAASRAVAYAQAVVVAGALAAGLAILGSHTLAPPVAWLMHELTGMRNGDFGLAFSFGSWGATIIFVLVAWMVLAPVAVWLAVTED